MICFDIKTELKYLDNCMVNLRNKEFSEVILLCTDEKITFTCDKEKHEELVYLGQKSVYGEDLLITIYAEHLTWVDKKGLNILPLMNISRWVIK